MEMEHERKFLLPGEYAVSHTPLELATLLGSCVGITLWHPTKRYAAMNHFLLPKRQNANSEIGRYGDTSTSHIIKLMKKLDPDVTKLQAGVFGGGAVLGHLGSTGKIGEKNLAIALCVLAENDIKVIKKDVGGNNGRRIYMDTETGKVRVCFIEKSFEAETPEKKLAARKTQVLIVEDSRIVSATLRKIIESAPDMEICGIAEDVFEARSLILETNPDIISLDIILPKMSGLTFLKELSKYYPIPVVICSSIARQGSDVARQAKKFGAISSIDKSKLSFCIGKEADRDAYISCLRKGAEIVVKKKLFD